MTLSTSKSISRRLSTKILRLTTGVFVAAIICVGIVSYDAVTEESRQNASRAISNSVLEIEKVLTDVESASNITAWIAQTNYGSAIDLNALTSEMLAADTAMIACGIAFDPNKFEQGKTFHLVLSTKDEQTNEVSTRVQEGDDYDYLSMDWYQIPKLTGKAFWNEPMYDDGGSSKMISTYSIPLYDDKGEFFGILRSDISLEWLSQVIDKFRPYESAQTLIVGKSGTFISSPDKEKILNETIYTECLGKGDTKTLETCRKVMAGESGISTMPFGGNRYYAVYAPLANGWRAIGLCNHRDFLKSAERINIALYLIAILGLIVLYIASRKIISKMTRPVTEFAYSAMNMSRGNFHTKIPDVDTEDELRKLHNSLTYLQSSINYYISQLKSTTSSKERMESELNIASMVQKSMLIHTFPHNDCDIYADLVPAKEIGGDLYDVIQDGDYIYFTVGDVSGKGVPASLFMAITRSAFRFATSLGLSVAETVSKINDNFCIGNEGGMFVTLFVARINIKTLEMEFCNAGHNPIVIVGPDGKAEYLHAKPNIASGLFPGFAYVGESVQLRKGSRLIVYTDGVTEAENKIKAQYGEDRLIDFASNIKAGATSREVVESLMSNVKAFAAGNDQNDDITILTVTLPSA